MPERANRVSHALYRVPVSLGTRARPYSGPVITVVGYDPAWPERFENLRAEYAAAMAAAGVAVVAIEHVGSTSVPGLAAKPIIDIDIVVREADVAAASGVLTSLGFTPQGDLGVPQRWAFLAPARLPRTNTYVIVDGCLSLRNHLAVRDVLRADEALRDEYAVVKKQAGARLDDIDEYVLAKNGIVQKILTAAGLTDAERASIAGNLRSPQLTRRGWLDAELPPQVPRRDRLIVMTRSTMVIRTGMSHIRVRAISTRAWPDSLKSVWLLT